VRHILVKTHELANRLYRLLKEGASFAALARRYTLDPGTKAIGGRLTISRGQTVPAFERAAFALKNGELSKPVKTQYGWHLIQALGAVLPSSRTPYVQVRERILQTLLSAEQAAAIADWQIAVSENWEPTVFYARGFKP
jgi:parvulin-like peptidyl-prolyl isomerase